ncbi:recombinase family protein [Mycobacterium avium subsp. hominissuis]|uniref:recombinase family protein n=1 Tax=Mycobacterium avium TaxID=1764 RepID=UPI000A042ED8|nr:recombinase family protein [Mycobacterium avium]
MNAERRKAIGYIRVSTNGQARNGYGLEAQRERIESFCKAEGFDLIGIVPDVMSGKRSDKLYGRYAAVAAIQAGLANVLVINAMDRATRDMLDGLKLLRQATIEGWRVVGVDGTDSATVDTLVLNAKLLVAEEERKLISKRTKQGLIAARQAGKQLGKPSTIDRKTINQIVKLRNDGLGAKAIAKALTDKGVPAPRGPVWHFSTVRNVLKREEVS